MLCFIKPVEILCEYYIVSTLGYNYMVGFSINKIFYISLYLDYVCNIQLQVTAVDFSRTSFFTLVTNKGIISALGQPLSLISWFSNWS